MGVLVNLLSSWLYDAFVKDWIATRKGKPKPAEDLDQLIRERRATYDLEYKERFSLKDSWLSVVVICITLASVSVELWFLFTQQPLISNRLWAFLAAFPSANAAVGILFLIAVRVAILDRTANVINRSLAVFWILVLSNFMMQAESVYRQPLKPNKPVALKLEDSYKQFSR